VPALENIWADSLGQSMAAFNFRTVTSKFNELVYQYPIRIPERYSLVIRCAERLPAGAYRNTHRAWRSGWQMNELDPTRLDSTGDASW